MTEPKERSWSCPQREELRVRITANISLGRINGGRDGDCRVLALDPNFRSLLCLGVPGCWEEGKSCDHLIVVGATSASTP